MLQFADTWLPRMPYSTNDFNNGITRHKRDSALEHRYVEANNKGSKNLLIIDLDDEDADFKLKSLVYDDGILPEPFYITENLATNHAHVAYLIDGFASSPRALSAFNNIRKGLTLLAGGDKAYTGLLTRNPNHSGQRTEYISDKRYSFNELSEFTNGIKFEVSKGTPLDASLGRNSYLFDKGRKFAYSYYANALQTNSVKFFNDALSDFLIIENMELPNPLPLNEIKDINASIYKWVQTKFSLKGLQAYGDNTRAKSLNVRKNKANQKRAALLEILQDGHSLKIAADTLGIPYSTALKLTKGLR